MPNYLHRTTKVYQVSLSPADLEESPANYIEDPDLSAVAGEPIKYWDIVGDIVSLLNQAGRDAADAAEAAEIQLGRRADAIEFLTIPEPEGLELRELIELFNKRDNYLINRIEELQTALTNMQAGSGNANARLDNLPTSYLATSTRTRAEAITDYTDDVNSGGAD